MCRENTIEVGDKVRARDGTIGKVRAIRYDNNNSTNKVLIDIYHNNWNIESVELYEDEMDFILIKA